MRTTRMMSREALCLLAMSAIAMAVTPASGGDQPEGQLIIKEDFEGGAARWRPTDERAWKVIDARGGKAYSLVSGSKYSPPFRSPLNFSLLKDVVVGDFVLEADLQSTGRDYGHRDLCLFFGYQDPAHFYYVHLARNADDHANQIFIVDGKDRSKISIKTTQGTAWDDEWHRIKLVRNTSDGAIEVYFDDMKQPVMTASDKTFAWGQIGVGSFDDTGNFDNLTVHGDVAVPPKAEDRLQ